MKKFHKISSAVLSVCLAAALLAVPVAADDTAGSRPDVQPQFLNVWADTSDTNSDDSISYSHTDEVVNYINEGPSMTASAIAHDSYTANAEAYLNGTLTVGLDSKVTDELKKEGYIRDLIRGIQNQRKENGYEVTDRIKLEISGDAVLKSAYEMFKDFVSGETLANSIAWTDSISDAVSVDADDAKWSFKVEKA